MEYTSIKRTEFWWILIFFLLLGGCGKGTPEAMYITIHPNWGEHEKPKTLKMLLYAESGEVLEYAMNSEGRVIKVPKGNYRMLLFNADPQNIVFNELSSFENAYAVIPATKAATSSTEVAPPGNLFAYRGEIGAESGATLPKLPMKSLIVKIVFEVKIQNAQQAKNIETAMRNVPDAILLGSGAPFYTQKVQENKVKMQQVSAEGDTFFFSSSTFGVCGNPDGETSDRIIAEIGIVYENGESKVITADVTDAIEQAGEAAGGGVVIVLEEIGLTAVVKEWFLSKGNGQIDDDK